MSIIAANELSAVLRMAPSVPASSTCREALRVMFQHPEAKCIVVCNSYHEPVGLLMCERFFLKVTGRTGMDLYRESVTKLMNHKPLTADISAPPALVLTAAMNRPDPLKQDCIIITSNSSFAGVVYTSDLIGGQQ